MLSFAVFPASSFPVPNVFSLSSSALVRLYSPRQLSWANDSVPPASPMQFILLVESLPGRLPVQCHALVSTMKGCRLKGWLTGCLGDCLLSKEGQDDAMMPLSTHRPVMLSWHSLFSREELSQSPALLPAKVVVRGGSLVACLTSLPVTRPWTSVGEGRISQRNKETWRC